MDAQHFLETDGKHATNGVVQRLPDAAQFFVLCNYTSSLYCVVCIARLLLIFYMRNAIDVRLWVIFSKVNLPSISRYGDTKMPFWHMFKISRFMEFVRTVDIWCFAFRRPA